MRLAIAALSLLLLGAISWPMSGVHRATATATLTASTVLVCPSMGGVHQGFVRLKIVSASAQTITAMTVTGTNGTTVEGLVQFAGTGSQAGAIVERIGFFVSDLALTSITATVLVTGVASGTADLECVGN